MTTTPDADVREALAGASHVAGLRIDTAAVLEEGHRAVRRRRAALAGLAAAATAVVAMVAVQLGTGHPRALPALPPDVSQTTGVSAGSRALRGSTFNDGIQGGPGFSVSVKPAADGQVTELWRLYDGPTLLGEVSLLRPGAQPGEARFLMPAESGQKGVVYGYFDTGSASGHLMTRLVTAPDLSVGSGVGGSLIDSTTKQVTGVLFMQEFTGTGPNQVIGLTWNRTHLVETTVKWLGEGAVLRPDRSGGVQAAVVVVSPRTSMLLWRDGDRFSSGSKSGRLSRTDAGMLQVATEPRSTAVPGMENDMAVGWVAGSAVSLSSTDPTDAFTVAYGTPVGGRTPFVALSRMPAVKGTVTVTGAGESQILTAWDAATP